MHESVSGLTAIIGTETYEAGFPTGWDGLDYKNPPDMGWIQSHPFVNPADRE